MLGRRHDPGQDTANRYVTQGPNQGSGLQLGGSSGLAPLQPGAPLLYAPTCAGARKYVLDTPIDRVQVPEELLQIKVQMLQQVHFVYQHEVRRAEHQRILEGLLLPLGDRVDYYPGVLPNLELRRTDQVPDVLYNQDVYVV